MGHKLAVLPEGHPFGEHLFQCLKCGCTFDVEGANIADFVLNCGLEKALRDSDPQLHKRRPILVRDAPLTPEKRSHHKGKRR